MRDKSAQILRARRLELGMTQEEVAIQLGMSLHQYQRYEYGEHRIAYHLAYKISFCFLCLRFVYNRHIAIQR